MRTAYARADTTSDPLEPKRGAGPEPLLPELTISRPFIITPPGYHFWTACGSRLTTRALTILWNTNAPPCVTVVAYRQRPSRRSAVKLHSSRLLRWWASDLATARGRLRW